MPPFLRRRLRWFLVVVLAISLTGPLTVWIVGSRLGIWPLVGASVFPGVACAILGVQHGFAIGRHRRRAHQAGWRVCFNCGYALQGLDDAGRCPECGRDYTLEELRRQWEYRPNR